MIKSQSSADKPIDKQPEHTQKTQEVSWNRFEKISKNHVTIKPKIPIFSEEEASLEQVRLALKAIEMKYVDCRKENVIVRNLSNFIFLQEHLNHRLLNNFTNQCKELLQQSKTIKQTPFLYSRLLHFWTQGFFNLIEEISRCTESYALTSLKNKTDKVQNEQAEQAKKRKGWSAQQTQKLQAILQQNQTVTTQSLRDLSKELNRSIVSIQSKVQKLLKVRKDDNDKGKFDDLSLQKKIVTILKGYPEGLNKQQILTKLEEQFEMGEELTWKKSASQLLCSSKNIQKLKGRFSFARLSGQISGGNGNIKGRVIKCLLSIPSHTATLKQILTKYKDLFGTEELALKEKRTESSISKALLKYSEFDKSHAKTTYRYIQMQKNQSIRGEQQLDMQSES